MSKLMSFYRFNSLMSAKDACAQWRLETLLENLPTCKELKYLVDKKWVTKPGDQLTFKVVCDI